jgi:hypothetical protein
MMSALITPLAEVGNAAATGDLLDRWSPLSDTPYLAVDLAGAGVPPETLAKLSLLPCPLIGVGRGDPHLESACDVVVADADGLRPLVDRVAAAPIAAMTLVQLLRASETLPVGSALNMESLAYATLQRGPEFLRWLAAGRKPASPVASTGEPAVLLRREGSALHIVLNRPAQRNEIDVAMRDGVVDALKLVLADPTIGPVTLQGAGKCFSVGGALWEFGTVGDAASAHVIRSVQLPARWLALCADRVTARLHGACIGAGIELPAFAGRVIAHRNTFFQLPELSMGLIPGAGGCVGIPRRIGRQRTAWLVLSGRRIDARTALRWGLVDELVD